MFLIKSFWKLSEKRNWTQIDADYADQKYLNYWCESSHPTIWSGAL